MGNYLQMADVSKIGALLELGWTYRRVARELGVHRTTVARYDRDRRSKPTNPLTGSVDLENRPNPLAGFEIEMPSTGPDSLSAPHHDFIAAGVKRGLTAQRIWLDLVEERGFTGSYTSVQRYVPRIRVQRPGVADVMEHPPGQEALCGFPHRASSPGGCSKWSATSPRRFTPRT